MEKKISCVIHHCKPHAHLIAYTKGVFYNASGLKEGMNGKFQRHTDPIFNPTFRLGLKPFLNTEIVGINRQKLPKYFIVMHPLHFCLSNKNLTRAIVVFFLS